MQIKIGRTTYIYDSIEQAIYKEDQLAKDQEKLLKITYRFIAAMRDQGYNDNMDYNNFDNYIKVLEPFELKDLYREIEETYLYISEYIGDEKTPQSDLNKCLSRIKRYEMYLYKIEEELK